MAATALCVNSPQTFAAVADFDTLRNGDTGATVTDYLARYGITVTGPGQLLVTDDRTMVFPPPSTPIVAASSGHIFLTADADASRNANYTLHFDPPLTRLSFTRILQASNNAGTVYPGWLATAFEGETALGTVGVGTFTYAVRPPTVLQAQPYTFSGSGITSLNVDSYQRNFAAFAAVFLDDFVMEPVLPSWNIDSHGNWSVSENWSHRVPNRADAKALFGGIITAPRTVTLDVPVTIGEIQFDNAHAYTIAGTGGLTVDRTVDQARIEVISGRHTISAPLTVADDAMFVVGPAASELRITNTVNAGDSVVSKSGAGTLTVDRILAPRLVIDEGAVSIAPHGSSAATSVLGSLAIAGGSTPTAKFDLNNNAVVLNYLFAPPASAIRSQVLAGRGGPGLGASWTGQGITSSAAAAANTTEPDSRSVGYALNGTMPLGAYESFRGQAVLPTSILLVYTRTGDANLDGVVNNDDVTILGANYAPGFTKPRWDLGDFDYNGFVDNDDVTLLGVFYNPTAQSILAMTPETGEVAAIPEPATLALFAGGLLFVCTWRGPIRRGFFF